MDKTTISKAIEKALEGKGKKKFTQTVEAVFNFKGLDTSKPENRVNLDIQLPKGRGKAVPVVVFGDTAVALDAQKAGAKLVLDAAGIAKLATNPAEVKRLAKECEFIAAPNLMVVVGKNLGQVLGSRGRLPRPIAGNVAEAMKMAASRVRLVTRGKYLPTVQCAIGSEAMSVPDLVENFEAVYEKVKSKVGEPAMGAIYVKLTMGTAVKVGAN
ncbi:MAG: 50S ribosomal protein L1 [Candidatus Micrarchaeota archaeon]|nr:50S ribosomal protein L1 [Candidatus Micrarchaeota archaeon]